MKKMYTKILLLICTITTPYFANGMFVKAVKRGQGHHISTRAELPRLTKTIEISPTLPQTFLDKLFGIKRPNPEYDKRFNELKQKQENLSFEMTLKTPLLSKQQLEEKLQQIATAKELNAFYNIGDIWQINNRELSQLERETFGALAALEKGFNSPDISE